METLRIGIIGTGWIAESHRQTLENVPGAEVSAVCDLDEERAAAFAHKAGARAYGRFEELLAAEELDAVFVCTPPRAHLGPALAALGAGIPLYLEKPIARSLEDASRIVEAVEASGAVSAVGYQWHALELLDDIAQLLAGDQVGLVVGTSIGPTASRPWFLDRQAGGGNLLERGSHHLDLVRTVAGEVGAVQAAAGHVRLARSSMAEGDIDDAVTLVLELVSGALATVVVAWTQPDQPGTYALDVVAPHSTLRLDLDPDFTLKGMSNGQQVSRRARTHPSEASVGRFLAAARAKDPSAVVCRPADALGTLRIAVAAERALETGRSVDLGEVGPG